MWLQSGVESSLEAVANCQNSEIGGVERGPVQLEYSKNETAAARSSTGSKFMLWMILVFNPKNNRKPSKCFGGSVGEVVRLRCPKYLFRYNTHTMNY